jgi:hypothetical protein
MLISRHFTPTFLFGKQAVGNAEIRLSTK